MRKLWLFLEYIWNAKKTWSWPRRSRVLIFDASHEALLREYVGGWSPEVLHVRGELVNVPVLLSCLFVRGRRLEAYLDRFVNAVQPRLILTMIDNNVDFLALKHRHPNVATLFVQNGWRTYLGDVFETLDRMPADRRASLEVDSMMTQGAVVGAEYSRYVKGTAVPIGSIKNNHVRREQSPRPGVIAFISQFRANGLQLGGRFYDHARFFEATDRLIVKFLETYAAENGKRLVIVPVNQEHGVDREAEAVYYQRLLGAEPEFVVPVAPMPSYHALDAAEVVVGVDSTLAYESVARGNKTALFCIRGGLLGIPSYNFGWPGDVPAEGSFWTSRPDPERFRAILNRLFAIDAAQWQADVSAASFSTLMQYDPGNTILRSVIAQHLDPNSQ